MQVRLPSSRASTAAPTKLLRALWHPERSDTHCVFCLAGVSYAVETPLPSVAFHIIIIAAALIFMWLLPALTVDASARFAARSITRCGRKLPISASGSRLDSLPHVAGIRLARKLG
jgi:hypothetical protein